MATIKSKENQVEKAKSFFKNNWWLQWIFSVMLVVINLYVYNRLNGLVAKYQNSLEKTTKGVVMLGYDGRTLYAERTLIDANRPGFKSAIKNLLVFYTVTDWERLTNAYNLNLENYEDILKTNKNLKEFMDNFIEDNDISKQNFITYLKTLIFLGVSDNLPEKISTISSEITDYKAKEDSSFEININVKVAANYYILEKDKWENKIGNINIRASGYFSPIEGTPINALGIKFKRITIIPVKKR